MEGRKQSGSSSSPSPFTSELFESKESSSTGILGSIFGQSSKYEGDGVDKQKRETPNQYNWPPISGISDDIPQRGEEANQGAPNRDVNPYYQEEKVQPCHLSSSIYYGGQDVYSHPKIQ